MPDATGGLQVLPTPIPGLLHVDLLVHGDRRGWFKESYHKAKLEALGLPALTIVQHNVSYNEEVGVTRGLHAEPWDKFISIAHGEAYGAWADLRRGPTFGATYSTVLTPSVAMFVPKGVANGYQTLQPHVVYTYLTTAHWSADAEYLSVNLFDPDLGVEWPIDRNNAVVSAKDETHPLLGDVTPVRRS